MDVMVCYQWNVLGGYAYCAIVSNPIILLLSEGLYPTQP